VARICVAITSIFFPFSFFARVERFWLTSFSFFFRGFRCSSFFPGFDAREKHKNTKTQKHKNTKTQNHKTQKEKEEKEKEKEEKEKEKEEKEKERKRKKKKKKKKKRKEKLSRRGALILRVGTSR
jgi:flagellar biosynthesis GTPase FlhF